ncbi:MAG: alpha/beta fold hydrolase, partial [Bryobacteraceae bacterium]
EKGAQPSPLLIVLGREMGDIDLDSFHRVGLILAGKGFLVVSLDLPCHGAELRPGESSGVAGWRTRLTNGENAVAGFTKRAVAVLSYLIEQKYADPKRIAVAGSSRGGFMALHLAAAEPRIAAAIAFAPVTGLRAVREFKGVANDTLVRSLDIMNQAAKLADRAIWISMGHNDTRVDSHHAIDFALNLMKWSGIQEKPMTDSWSGDRIKLTITPSESPDGHSTYRSAHEEAAQWLLTRLSARHE